MLRTSTTPGFTICPSFVIQELINSLTSKSADASFPLLPFGLFVFKCENGQDQRKMKLKPSGEFLLAIFRLFKLIIELDI